MYCSTVGERGCVVLNEMVIILLNGKREGLFSIELEGNYTVQR
jgi:hypothetical protein